MLIQYNFARVTDIATVLKSLLDSSIPRQFLDLLEYTTVFRLKDKTCCARTCPQASRPPYVTLRLLHRRALRQAARLWPPFKKVGVWEDTRMLKFSYKGVVPQETDIASGVQVHAQ